MTDFDCFVSALEKIIGETIEDDWKDGFLYEGVVLVFDNNGALTDFYCNY